MASPAEPVKSASAPLDTGLQDDDLDWIILEGVGHLWFVLIGEVPHGTAKM